MIQFNCSHCGQPVQVAEEHTGLQVQCPSCGQTIAVPPDSSVAAEQDAEQTRGRGMAIAALVLGIVSFIPFLGVLTGLTAVILGIIVLAMGSQAKRMAVTGLLCGILLPIASTCLLISALIPSLSKSGGLANRARCMTNINGLGKGLAMYHATFDDQYPLLFPGAENYDEALAGASDDLNTMSDNVNENLNLLVQQRLVPWKLFRCPEVGSEIMDRSAEGGYGFVDGGGKVYLDYAYHNGTSGADNYAPFSQNLSGGFVLLGDQPGEVGTDSAFADGDLRGYNHGADGVAVLTASSSVRFSEDTFLAGKNDNNIYSADMDENGNVTSTTAHGGWPNHEDDTVLIDPRP